MDNAPPNPQTIRSGDFLWRTVQDSNRAAAHSAVSKATVRLCLARGSQRVGMSTKKDAVIRSGDFLLVDGTGLEQQQRRLRPAAETGRSCWGSVLIFQGPAMGLTKNQQTQPVRRHEVTQAISPVGCCLARDGQRPGMSTRKEQRQGNHHGGGALPFCIPLYCAFQVNCCVRAYMAGTHVRRKKGKFRHIEGSLSGCDMIYSAQIDLKVGDSFEKELSNDTEHRI